MGEGAKEGALGPLVTAAILLHTSMPKASLLRTWVPGRIMPAGTHAGRASHPGALL